MRKAGGQHVEFLQYTLTNVMISAYHVSSGGDRPTESLTLNFTKIEMQAAPTQGGATAMGATNNGLPPGPAGATGN